MTERAGTDPVIAVTGIVRSLTAGGLAGALAGLLVGGVGGRLAMRLSGAVAARIDPIANFRFTENGNRVGQITAEGTIELLIFGGILGGLIAGVYWVMLRPWMPWRRHLLAAGAVLGAGLGGAALVQPDNRDFAILEPAWFNVLLFTTLGAAIGAAIVALDRWLQARLPQPNGRWQQLVGYGIVLSFGAPLAIPALGSLLSESFCFCETPPIAVGLFMVLAGAATAASWAEPVLGPRQIQLVGLAGRMGTAGVFVSAWIYLGLAANQIL